MQYNVSIDIEQLISNSNIDHLVDKSSSENGYNLAFTFTSDNPMLQMDELTKEMESLRASSAHARSDPSIEASVDSTGGNSDSGHHSDFGSRLNLSAAADMAKVQKCQFKIQELEKEAGRARFCNRNLMQEYAEQLKVMTILI